MNYGKLESIRKFSFDHFSILDLHLIDIFQFNSRLYAI